MTLPRLLTIMGSGETAPTMVKVHRSVAKRLLEAGANGAPGETVETGRAADSGLRSVRGLLLDTPFGFQTNASEIAARAVSYFAESVGCTLEIARIRSAADLEGTRGHEIVARMAALPMVFSGPGSPSYALRQWRDTLIPSLLEEKLRLGGAVTFASAAALTLGRFSVPVYEVYKVGEDPHWIEGLDLLEQFGLPAVVIPHYDNTEGQTHDTRYCYLGEERLSLMEKELTDGTFVIGVDEHTALCIDLEAGSASVVGRGAVTVRALGHSAHIEAESTVTLSRLREMASELARGPSRESAGEQETSRGSLVGSPCSGTPSGASGSPTGSPAGSPLLVAIRAHESEFRAARDRSDARAMTAAALALEEEMWAWRADTLQSDEMDRGRASLRAMVSELGRIAEVASRDPTEVLRPYVDLLLVLRDAARAERRFEEADSVRDRLVSLGVAVHDTSEGSTWELQRSEAPAASALATEGAEGTTS